MEAAALGRKRPAFRLQLLAALSVRDRHAADCAFQEFQQRVGRAGHDLGPDRPRRSQPGITQRDPGLSRADQQRPGRGGVRRPRGRLAVVGLRMGQLGRHRLRKHLLGTAGGR